MPRNFLLMTLAVVSAALFLCFPARAAHPEWLDKEIAFLGQVQAAPDVAKKEILYSALHASARSRMAGGYHKGKGEEYIRRALAEIKNGGSTERVNGWTRKAAVECGLCIADFESGTLSATGGVSPPTVASVPGPSPVASLPHAAPAGGLTADQAAAVVLIAGDHAEGTGFLVMRPEGPAVVTNLHVLGNNPNLKITTNSGAAVRMLSAQGASDRDLALLSIKDDHYHYLVLAADVSKAAQAGDPVVTPGNSQGGEVMLNTTGKVLGIGPQRIEFNNPIYHGNSGGPVVQAASGQALGVVTEAMKVDTSNALDKASFASRGSAIGGSMRYFGLRLDTVPAWVSIEWGRFQTETAFLDQFHNRSRCLDSYLNTSPESKPSTRDWKPPSPFLSV